MAQVYADSESAENWNQKGEFLRSLEPEVIQWVSGKKPFLRAQLSLFFQNPKWFNVCWLNTNTTALNWNVDVSTELYLASDSKHRKTARDFFYSCLITIGPLEVTVDDDECD